MLGARAALKLGAFHERGARRRRGLGGGPRLRSVAGFRAFSETTATQWEEKVTAFERQFSEAHPRAVRAQEREAKAWWKARVRAAGVLGAIGDERAVEPLIGGLKDDEAPVRSAILPSGSPGQLCIP